jgi:hypothetical protein
VCGAEADVTESTYHSGCEPFYYERLLRRQLHDGGSVVVSMETVDVTRSRHGRLRVRAEDDLSCYDGSS